MALGSQCRSRTVTVLGVYLRIEEMGGFLVVEQSEGVVWVLAPAQARGVEPTRGWAST